MILLLELLAGTWDVLSISWSLGLLLVPLGLSEMLELLEDLFHVRNGKESEEVFLLVKNSSCACCTLGVVYVHFLI